MNYRGHTFISLGNGNQPFNRLIAIVKDNYDKFPKPIIIQYGSTVVEDSRFICFDFLGEKDYFDLLTNAYCFITHGGVGSILSATQVGVKAIVLPREAKYCEVVDDHQISFTMKMVELGRIVMLEEYLNFTDSFNCKLELDKNNNDDRKYLRIFLEEMNSFKVKKLCLVCSNGGHLRELIQFRDFYNHYPHFFVLNGTTKNENVTKGKYYVFSLFERDLYFFRNLWEAVVMFNRERPNLILSTGAGICIPVALVAKCLGVKIYYIETMAKVTVLSKTGHIMKVLSDKFFVPYKNIKGAPKSAVILGSYF
jgi:beta-1,4-N-acetylglucosaminyltransferase